MSQDKANAKEDELVELLDIEAGKLEAIKKEKTKELEQILHVAEQELKDLKPLRIISEHIYHDLSLSTATSLMLVLVLSQFVTYSRKLTSIN